MFVYVLYGPSKFPLVVFNNHQHGIDTVKASFPDSEFKIWKEDECWYVAIVGRKALYTIERFTRLCGPTRL